MANVGPTVWFVRDNAPTSTVGWSAVTAWATGASKAPGALVRQTSPSVGNERVFVAVQSATQNTGGSEPTWTVTKGAVQTTDGSVVWQECTGQPGVNGDLTNTPTWAQQHASSTTISIGLIIQDAAADCIFIAKTGTTIGSSEPSWNKTAGATTTDNAVTWVSLGAPGNFATWSAPFARLASAYATNWGAAGHTFFVGDDHAETQSTALTITSPGSISNPTFTYSMNHAASFPLGSGNLLAGATLTITGSVTLTANGSGYYYGVTLATSGANNGTLALGSNQGWLKFDTCALKKAATTANNWNFASARIDLINTTFQFGNTSDTVQLQSTRLNWKNTASAIAGATFPTNMFNPNTNSGGIVVCEGVDLSALGSGKTLVQSTNAQWSGDFHFIDCALNASVSITGTVEKPNGPHFYVTRSAATGLSYAQHQYNYVGTLDHETTIIRTGGASDGTTGISWKITTTGNSRWGLPFEAIPISIWNSTLGNVTVTVYGIWGGGAVPNNDDIWIDVEYLGAAGTPLASIGSGTKTNNLATASPLSSDSSTWGGSTTKFKMSVLLSAPQPQLVGYLRVYVKAAKSSTVFYVDPLPVLS